MCTSRQFVPLLLFATACAPATRVAPPVDLVLVTIDTLRADALGYSSQGRVETPVLDRLAREGLIFSNARAHNVATLPSHANIFTGLYPYEHGVRDNGSFALPPEVETVATRLARAGYATAAVVGAFPLERRFGLARGFELYDDAFRGAPAREAGAAAERRGDRVVERALTWWRSASARPRFLWIHLYDPHAPYAPPEPFASLYSSAPYLGEVAAVDSFLLPLLAPLLDRRDRPAHVLVTSDHGEALGEHGETTHGLFAYESTLRVPLLLWGPGISPGVDRREARHIDIAPTLLQLAGVAHESLPGSSLLAPDSRGACYFEALSPHFGRGWAPLRGVVAEGWKWIDLPLPELYDLEGDPAELHNRVGEETDRVRALRHSLPEFRDGRSSEHTLDRESTARLASLGYLVGVAHPAKSYDPADDPKHLVSIQTRLHELVELTAAGDTQRASAAGFALIRDAPALAEAYEALAVALRAADRHDAAIELLRSGLDRVVDRRRAAVALATALVESGLAGEAVSALEEFRPNGDPDLLRLLGDALSASGDPDAGLALLAEADATRPNDPAILEAFGFAHLRRDDPLAARAAFERALAIDPGLSTSWNGLGVALEAIREPGAALASFARAVELDTKNWDALFNFGLVAVAAGSTGEGRAALESFARHAPRRRLAVEIERAKALLAAEAR